MYVVSSFPSAHAAMEFPTCRTWTVCCIPIRNTGVSPQDVVGPERALYVFNVALYVFNVAGYSPTLTDASYPLHRGFDLYKGF